MIARIDGGATRFKIRATALFTVAALLCLFSTTAVAASGNSEYSGSLHASTEKLQIAFVENMSMSSNDKDPLAELAKEYTPNGVNHLRTISPKGVSTIVVDAKYIGVAVEPSVTENFELELVGVKNPKAVKANVTVKNGELTLTASSTPSVGYICADAATRVNTVVLRVPAQKYTSIKYNADNAVVLAPDLGATMKGVCAGGIVAVIDDEILSDCTLSTDNGTAYLKGGRIAGTTRVETQNGSATLVGGQVTGPLFMRAQNGMVNVKADSLAAAELTTRNGWVSLDAGVLTGDVIARTENGRVYVNLRSRPKNLTLDAARGANGRSVLPAGWKADERIGNGSPRLQISCTNGNLELGIGQSRG